VENTMKISILQIFAKMGEKGGGEKHWIFSFFNHMKTA